MVHLVDKKFGGELTKADVFGVEVDEFDTDEEDGGQMGLVRDDDVRSSISSKRSARSARSRKSAKSRKSKASKRSQQHVRKRPPLLPLDWHNDAYLAMREEARARRMATDWHAHNLQHISELAATRTLEIRSEWATWNPYRAAARELEERIRAGSLTLADTIAARAKRDLEPLPGTIPAGESLARGWYPHGAPFKWPAPQDPGTFARHPHAPSQFRREQLAEPWAENELSAPLPLRPAGGPEGSVPLVTTVKNPGGLFGQDPAYWKTVHLGGEGRAKEEADRKAGEKAEWTRKLVVEDPVMRVTLPLRPRPTQTDRVAHILADLPPKKKGFAVSHVDPAPYSMHLSEPWHEPKPAHGLRGPVDAHTFTRPGTDFVRHLAIPKKATCKPGMGNSQAWTAALHDARYEEN